MVLTDMALTNLSGIISFLVKNSAIGMIVSTSGLEMPGLQGSFKIADPEDGLHKWILVLSLSKVSQFLIDGTNLSTDTDIMKREL